MVEPDQLPWSAEAEQSVLGGLLLDNSAWDRVADLLKPASFFSGQHALIFDAIGTLIVACKPADIITVAELLRDRGKEDVAGGHTYLNALAASVPSAANIRRYAEIVAEKHHDRALRETADEANAIAAGSGTVIDRLERIVQRFAQLERKGTRQVPVEISGVVMARIDFLNDLATNGATVPMGISTRFPWLDALLRGFKGGRVYLLAARPSMGKSALAQWWGLKASVGEEAPVLMLSQEMNKEECGDRSLVMVGGVPYDQLQDGKLTDESWGRLSTAVERCARAPFYVDDQPSLTSNDIRVKARFVKGLRLLIIDYVQLCKGAEEGELNRNAELEVISREIKSLAKLLDIPIIVLSQLARRVEERPAKRALMSDLKDCGGLEQDADVIMTLFPLGERTDGHLIGMDVLKNRQGKKGCGVLHFNGDILRWSETEYEVEELLPKRGSRSKSTDPDA